MEKENIVTKTSHGTLITAIITRRGAYLAADSHGTSPPSDSEQKLFKCGNVGFVGIAGTLVCRASMCTDNGKVICSGVFNTSVILSETSLRYPGDASSALQNIGSIIYKELKPFWECHIASTYDSFIRSNPSGIFCEIPLLTWENGSASVSVLRFEYRMLSPHLSKPVQELCPVEIQDGLQKIKQWGTTISTDGIDLTGDSEERVLEVIDGLYNRAFSRHPDTIGGPIDIGFIDTDGPRWLRNKGDFHR